jgi:hypothetical protein
MTMAIKFYDFENRLIACDDDGCAVWQRDAGKWAIGSVDLARRAWLDGDELSKAEAAREFPAAKLDDLPDLSEAKAKAEAGYVPISAAELKRLGVTE